MHGTPVKSCMTTRAGRNGSSFSAGAAAFQTQLYFLFQRATQVRALSQPDLFAPESEDPAELLRQP